MRLSTLAVGLSLLSVAQTIFPPLIEAQAEQLLGLWYIRNWAGNMPIPRWKWTDPLPPFAFARNGLMELEFRMNLTKPIGCVQFKLPLYEEGDAGVFLTWWRHIIYIYFLPEKKFAIAYFRGRMNYRTYYLMMLMGRSLNTDLYAVKIFKEFVATKLANRTIITPPHKEACELARES